MTNWYGRYTQNMLSSSFLQTFEGTELDLFKDLAGEIIFYIIMLKNN